MAVKISDMLPLPIEVSLGRGSLPIHGIELTALTRLLVAYKDRLMLFLSGQEKNYESLLLSAPDLVVDLIAHAADAVGQEDDIRKIPPAVQLECLGAIYKLSVPDEKKFAALLEGLLLKFQQLRARGAALQASNSSSSLPSGSQNSSQPATDPPMSQG